MRKDVIALQKGSAMKLGKNCAIKNEEFVKAFAIVVIIFSSFFSFLDLFVILLEIIWISNPTPEYRVDIVYLANLFAFGMIAFRKINRFMFTKLRLIRVIIFTVVIFLDVLGLIYIYSIKDYLIVPIYLFTHKFLFLGCSIYSSVFIIMGVNPFEEVRERE